MTKEVWAHYDPDMRPECQYFVYMASKPSGTLYVGMMNNIGRRAYEHRQALIDGFTETYEVKTLVHFESFPTAMDAIHREKRVKKWPRAYKIISSWRTIRDGMTSMRH
jgi:putative endonuclease